MKSFVLFAAAVAALSLTSVSAIAADAPAAQAPASNPDKKICRREAQGTGSIMPKRVCRTQAEWDAMERAAANDIDRIRAQERSKGMVGLGH